MGIIILQIHILKGLKIVQNAYEIAKLNSQFFRIRINKIKWWPSPHGQEAHMAKPHEFKQRKYQK